MAATNRPINNDTARTLGLKTGSQVSVQGVHTTMTGHRPARMTATAGDLVLPSKYLALDLSKLARSCGRPLDGLLGADFIHGRVVMFDFASHQLRFVELASPAKSDTVVPLKASRDGFCVPVGVDDRRPQWMRLDTGCATDLQWETSDLTTSAQSDKPAIGLAELAIPQAKTTVSLGEQRFDQVPTGIHAIPFSPVKPDWLAMVC